jgi:hypothetical protein
MRSLFATLDLLDVFKGYPLGIVAGNPLESILALKQKLLGVPASLLGGFPQEVL